MCDNHKHTKLEEWITPIDSKHLSSKMVHLFPGDHVHQHSTGAGREEVLIVLFGSITVTLEKSSRVYSSGETCFIPENTLHAVSNDGDAPAQYAYVVTKKQLEFQPWENRLPFGRTKEEATLCHVTRFA